MTSNQCKGYLGKMLSSSTAQKRAICLGLVTCGVVLILLSFAHISEAKSSSPTQIVTLESETPCEICHEEAEQAEQATVRVALQTVSANAIALHQQSANLAFETELNEIETMLANARQLLEDGDTNAAQALVDHAQQLVKQVEEQARINEEGRTNPFAIVGVLSQKSVFDLSINRHVMTAAYHPDQSLSLTENDRVWGIHAEDLYRRAPPSDEASDLNTIHNLTFQSRRLPLLNVQSFFVLTRYWKYTGVDRSSGYFV